MKYFEKRKLKKYLLHLESGKFYSSYIEYHKHRIDCLKWIIGSYEGIAGNPKELLEAFMNPYRKNLSESDIQWLTFLYHWTYYKKITGF